MSEKFGLNSVCSDFSDVNIRKMLCLSKFVTMNHAKTGFMFSENVVSGILCPGKLKKPHKVLSHEVVFDLSLNAHNTFVKEKNLPGESRTQILSTDMWVKYIPYPVYLLLVCSIFALPAKSEIPVDCPARLQSGGLREVTPLKCFFGKVIKGFKSACKYLENIFLRKKNKELFSISVSSMSITAIYITPWSYCLTVTFYKFEPLGDYKKMVS